MFLGGCCKFYEPPPITIESRSRVWFTRMLDVLKACVGFKVVGNHRKLNGAWSVLPIRHREKPPRKPEVGRRFIVSVFQLLRIFYSATPPPFIKLCLDRSGGLSPLPEKESMPRTGRVGRGWHLCNRGYLDAKREVNRTWKILGKYVACQIVG